ncbi:MAG: c-type cytochrome [Candidatus Methylomirabilales bacterium]
MKGTRAMRTLSPTAREGRRLVEVLHCNACHSIPGMGHGPAEHGHGHGEGGHAAVAPDLSREGEKVRPEWLFAFLKQPHPIRPALAPRMPDFRLIDREALAFTLHILTDMRDSPRPPEVAAILPPPSLDPKLVEAGKKLMSPAYFTCFSCHYQGEKKPEGKPEDQAPDLIEAGQRLQPTWIIRWIRNPQSIVPDTKMPTFFTDPDSGPEDILGGDEEKQLEAVVATVIALGQEGPPQHDYEAFARAKATYPDVIPGDGWALMAEMNCAGCHDITRMHERVVVAPPLAEEGSRVRPAWLRSFLRSPHTIRPAGYIPGTAVRMPDFRLSSAEANVIADFLEALRNGRPPLPVPTDPVAVAWGRELFRDLRCGSCHRTTADRPVTVQRAFEGPDLQGVGLRLQLAYLIGWLGGEKTADAHPVVPSFGLSREQRAALAAYIGTLRTPTQQGTRPLPDPSRPENGVHGETGPRDRHEH